MITITTKIVIVRIMITMVCVRLSLASSKPKTSPEISVFGGEGQSDAPSLSCSVQRGPLGAKTRHECQEAIAKIFQILVYILNMCLHAVFCGPSMAGKLPVSFHLL